MQKRSLSADSNSANGDSQVRGGDHGAGILNIGNQPFSFSCFLGRRPDTQMHQFLSRLAFARREDKGNGLRRWLSRGPQPHHWKTEMHLWTSFTRRLRASQFADGLCESA